MIILTTTHHSATSRYSTDRPASGHLHLDRFAAFHRDGPSESLRGFMAPIPHTPILYGVLASSDQLGNFLSGDRVVMITRLLNHHQELWDGYVTTSSRTAGPYHERLPKTVLSNFLERSNILRGTSTTVPRDLGAKLFHAKPREIDTRLITPHLILDSSQRPQVSPFNLSNLPLAQSLLCPNAPKVEVASPPSPALVVYLLPVEPCFPHGAASNP